MHRADFHTAPALPLAPLASSAPAGGAAGAAFADIHDQVQNEVRQFLEHGAGDAVYSGGLSAEGLALRSRTQTSAAAAVPAGSTEQQFLASVMPLAQQAGQRLGVAPELVAAHAALESGWGRHPLRQADGNDSHNLFGIKAGAGWQGAVVAAATTEYEAGVALNTKAGFRSYPDQASAFHDYTDVLLNPRYRSALNVGSDAQAFARGLVQGGYATDPAYADKLASVAARLMKNN
jgi:flagellar protein FlgJ